MRTHTAEKSRFYSRDFHIRSSFSARQLNVRAAVSGGSFVYSTAVCTTTTTNNNNEMILIIMKSQEVNFQKLQKLLASPAGSLKQTKAGTAFTYIVTRY